MHKTCRRTGLLLLDSGRAVPAAAQARSKTMSGIRDSILPPLEIDAPPPADPPPPYSVDGPTKEIDTGIVYIPYIAINITYRTR